MMAGEFKYPIITISREYGAGGRSIAKGLSQKLGIPWYDKDFVTITAQKSGYSEEEIYREGEELSAFENLIDSLLNNMAAYNSSHDAIFKAQKESLLDLVDKDPCIVVGRCANMILREAGKPSFEFYLYANLDIRVDRARYLVNEPVQDIRKYVEKIDSHREQYYKKYTKSLSFNANDYNICLDTGVIQYDKCIDIIADLVTE